MATSTAHSLRLDVDGDLPAGLSGRLLGVERHNPNGDRVVHDVELCAGRMPSYRQHVLRSEVVAGHIVAFGGSILAVGCGSPAYELTSELDTVRRVDLAGQARELATCPRLDPASGDLHVVTTGGTGAQSHVAVSAGALTRTARTMATAPGQIMDLAITRDRVVFAADGFAGVAARGGAAPTTWIPTGAGAAHLVHAHDAGDVVVVIALTPALERWTLDPETAVAQREVLDASAPQLVFVDDATRAGDGRGWLVGFGRCRSADDTAVVLLDDVTLAPIATVRIDLRIARPVRTSWIAHPASSDNEGDRP